MALIMGKDSSLVFYEKVLGANSTSVTNIKYLLDRGVSFEDGLYILKASYQGKVFQHNLKVGASALMKGTVPAAMLTDEKIKIINFVQGVYDSLLPIVSSNDSSLLQSVASEDKTFTVLLTGFKNNSGSKIPAIKALRTFFHWDLYTAKNHFESVCEGQTINAEVPMTMDEANIAIQELVKVGFSASVISLGVKTSSSTFQTAPKPKSKLEDLLVSSGVVSLRDAEAINQPVKGSSADSIYRCIAYNDRIKIASRIKKSGTISIRAEWKGATQTELQNLAKAGLDMKDKYASMHLDSSGVSAAKVLGAFLMDTGIDYQEMVKPTQIVEEP